MPEYSTIGTVNPFLHVALRQGEKIFAESGAMVTMDTTLDLNSQARGGIMSSLIRRMANDESFFQQTVLASRGPGDVLLAPVQPGGLEILDIGETQYLLNDGVFLAADDSVQLTATTQGIGQALFGGTGGFFLGKTAGRGKLVVSGFGDVFGLDVTPGNDVIVDNTHVVAWDSRLQYNISVSTSGGGMFQRLVNSVTSGEGVVNRFSGSGKVYVCSRNHQSFIGWIASKLPTSKSN